MSSQLERLARPFPARYVKAPAQGKYGSYVPHDVVTQALLAIVGPYDLDVGEIFHGIEGEVEGCLVTLTVEVDGRRVSVTEVGDCEKPSNWKTQGARMKDAISDGVKRCAMRLGLGLHLWAQEDYFLYDQLLSVPSGSTSPEVERQGGPDDAQMSASGPPVSSLPADRPGEVAAGSGVSQNQLAQAKARALALTEAGVEVRKTREKANLPALVKDIDPVKFAEWVVLLDVLEKTLEESRAPFAEVTQ